MHNSLTGQSPQARVQGDPRNVPHVGSEKSEDLAAANQLVKDLEFPSPQQQLNQHEVHNINGESSASMQEDLRQIRLPSVAEDKDSLEVPIPRIQALLHRANLIEQELQRVEDEKKFRDIQIEVDKRVAETFEEKQGTSPISFIISEAKHLGIRPEAVEQAYAEMSRYRAWDDNRRQRALDLGLPEDSSAEVIALELDLKQKTAPLIEKMEDLIAMVSADPIEYQSAALDLGRFMTFQSAYDAFSTRLSARPLATLLWYCTPLVGQSMFLMSLMGKALNGDPMFADINLPDVKSTTSPALKALQASAKRLGAEVSFVLEREKGDGSFMRVAPHWALPEYVGVRAILRLPKQSKD